MQPADQLQNQRKRRWLRDDLNPTKHLCAMLLSLANTERKNLHVGPSNSCWRHQNSTFLNPYAPKIFAIVVFDVPAADDIVCSAMFTRRFEKCFFQSRLCHPELLCFIEHALKLCANLQDTYCVLHLRLDREDNKIPKRHSPVQVLFRFSGLGVPLPMSSKTGCSPWPPIFLLL